MSQSDPLSTGNVFNISSSSVKNLVGSGSIHYSEATAEADKQNSQIFNQRPTAESASGTATAIKTILFLAANPKGTAQLRLDEEVREIDAGLQRAKRHDQFVLQQRWAVRTRDVQRAMLDFKPQIIHFSGHGEGEDGLVLEDEFGKGKFVDTEALAGLFELFADLVECVVLNACYSEAQAEAIARHIPYVIGMNKAIGDHAAIEFAVSFYDALGSGESVEFAYKLGCSAIRLAGIKEYLTPVLKNNSA